MTKQQNNKALMFTIVLITFMQMPQFAIMPATNLIATEVFPNLSLPVVQAAMALPGLVAVPAGVAVAMLVRYGLASKKGMTVFGLSLLVLTGLVALALHTQFWQLCLMNILVGIAIGIFVPNAQSIMFDNFDEKTRQLMSGATFSSMNGGGLIMSLITGWLTTIVWYGGHLQMLIAIPIVIVAIVVIPKDRKTRSDDGGGGERTRLPVTVYYFTLLIVVFMIIYNVATVNISTHLENEGGYGSSVAGFATAFLMVGGVAAGFVFPKLSQVLRDHLFTVSFVILAIGFSLMNLFPASLPVTFAATFICGTTMSLLVPRCIFNVSNLTNPSNSATATMLVCCIAPGAGHFLSPVIITNLTLALGGESTRFRFQFTAFVCLALAVVLFVYDFLRGKASNNKE